MIKKLYTKYNKNLGIKFFNNPNTINYNIFNILYKNLIMRNKLSNDHINEFHKKGFFKTKVSSNKLVELINDKVIKPQEDKIIPGTKKHIFFLPDNIKEEIINLISDDYKKIIEDLEIFYNNKISITEIVVRRNYPLNNEKYYKNKLRAKEMEVYNNYYHVDYYVSAFFKMFVNLSEVKSENGPLHIYDIKATGDYLKKFKYNSRFDYEPNELIDKLNINSGKPGESFIADTTKCLHRAGVVEKNYRDILFVVFGLIPKKFKSLNIRDSLKYFNNISENSIWDHSGKFTKIYKPKNLRQTLKLFWKLKNSKIN